MPDFTDTGIVLSLKRHGEHAFILSAFTQNHGRYLGLLRTKTPVLIGSQVFLKWHARLSEHLGTFTLDDIHTRAAAFMEDKKRLLTLSCLCSLLELFLPERENFDSFYTEVITFLDTLEEPDFLRRYVLLELRLLSIAGFGLDLSNCAGGGDPQNLAYVSPKSGRAVSLEKGRPYARQLLILPEFLHKDISPTHSDIHQGLLLTGFFLGRQVKLPQVRQQLVASIL